MLIAKCLKTLTPTSHTKMSADSRITEASAKQFAILPDGHALETMADLKHGSFASLDAASPAIEKLTRGVCRRNPGEDQP